LLSVEITASFRRRDLGCSFFRSFLAADCMTTGKPVWGLLLLAVKHCSSYTNQLRSDCASLLQV